MPTFFLLLLMIAGPAGAAPLQQIGRPGGGEREPEIEPGGRGGGEPEAGGGVDAEAEAGGTALRINFEVSGHKARSGLYLVRYPGGDELASWFARSGATDSGWINVEIDRKTVWVEVIYYPGPNAAGTAMRILNPAPGTAYGWVSQGVAHAIEVAWPDMPLRPADPGPLMPDGTPWSAYYGTAPRPFGMPGGPGGAPGGPGGMPGRPGGPGGMPGQPGGMPGRPGG